ncbi:unnamed protein product [[Actinomadura] parvosata subsp. kistnae]|uniref:Abortive infection protein n=1 Tax=[Actinomadura] parvosata subsp. kistnae TaxID=1909395 RepID=A0A1V0A452_9ACTN|nr:hypothetical protein [Nonomuraea sp. ATCC 55076]AQZ64980.1 hypothetical protein BKM31_29190 [Nonomuraea sp. ATCC 55076]SPL96225.1 unnamed protein product [Actinomadura parvosata subsp. kistnae]
MKKGINYDTGFLPGSASRETFDPETVARDMRVIADDLHCEVVRISGMDPRRMTVAAERAAAAGLEVWFAPFPVDLDQEQLIPALAAGAELAESLRRSGAEVVYVTGCETSAFGKGFIEGESYRDRLDMMGAGDENWWRGLMTDVMPRFNAYLAQMMEAVRPVFGGRITYAAGPWERIDWTPFDIVSSDAYRAAYNAHDYTDELRALFTHGKPVAVTEFGTCAYKGAGDLGGMAWVVPEGAVRDEGEQVRYFHELLDIFEAEGVETALWFTYAAYNRFGEDDLGSYGVIRMLDETRWEPKEVFHAMAARYAR